MIDIHFHCLPGIDDGPADWEQAVALCREAAAQGTRTIVATPHVLHELWLNDSSAVRDELLLKLNDALGGTPAILAGCELWYSRESLESLAEKGANPVTTLNRGRYLLVEFAPGFVPREAGEVFHELSVGGLTPVVAHPERNLVFAREPQRLAELVGCGAVVQVTAESLLGELGKRTEEATEKFYEMGILHVVASDAHSLDVRPPRLAAARERVRRTWGEEAAVGLFERNPEAVVKSEPLPWRSS